MSEALLKIGEIAAFFNISVKTIRLYDKKGLLKPAKTDPATGYRYYTADQAQQLQVLLELRAWGFSLVEVKDILTGKIDEAGLLAKLTRKHMAWLDAMTLAGYKAETINKAINILTADETAKGQALKGLTPEERAWRLAKMICVEGTATQKEIVEALWL